MDQVVKNAITYLEILQNGRVKPDKFQNHPSVRDSIDNTQSIAHITACLNKYFETELKKNGK